MRMGSQPAVEATLTSHAQGSGGLKSNTALMALLQGVKPGSTFWMVGDQSLLASLPTSIPAPGASAGGGSVALPSLVGLTVTGDLDPQVSVAITGEAKDAAAAKNLADVVRGLVAMASLQAAQKPELSQLASAVSVATEENRVLVTARIPYETLDALQPKRPQAVQSTPEPAPSGR